MNNKPHKSKPNHLITPYIIIVSSILMVLIRHDPKDPIDISLAIGAIGSTGTAIYCITKEPRRVAMRTFNGLAAACLVAIVGIMALFQLELFQTMSFLSFVLIAAVLAPVLAIVGVSMTLYDYHQK